jgi:hypothetical protein
MRVPFDFSMRVSKTRIQAFLEYHRQSYVYFVFNNDMYEPCCQYAHMQARILLSLSMYNSSKAYDPDPDKIPAN